MKKKIRRPVVRARKSKKSVSFDHSNDLLAKIFASIPDGISVSDTAMKVMWVNEAMEKWYSHAMPIVGKKCYKVYHGRNKPCDICPVRTTFNTGEMAYEVVPKTGPGKKVIGWQDLYSFPMKDKKTGCLLGVVEYVRDITERKKAENQYKEAAEKLKNYSDNLEEMVVERTRELDGARADLFAAAKLSAMGRMGAGIAHQLNSPICGGILLTDALTEICRDSPKEIGILKKIRGIFDSMHSIIECMLGIARVSKGAGESRIKVSINSVLKNLLDFVSLEFGKHEIKVITEFEPDLPKIELNEGEIDHVFLNVINNAVDAMTDGGALFIKTSKANGAIEIVFRDTGSGISKETIEKLFEPFFTTRTEQHGIGLGLFIAKQIVERAGGKISVKSEEGKGAEFTVRLPVREA